jgi:hypothetical protein
LIGSLVRYINRFSHFSDLSFYKKTTLPSKEAQLVALSGNRRVSEDGPDVPDLESLSDEHGEKLTQMYTPEGESLEQARIRIAMAGSPGTVSAAARQDP